MAVEVIGHDPDVYIKRTCKKCGSILQYVPNDIETDTHRSYDGSTDTYQYITCPTCKSKVTH